MMRGALKVAVGVLLAPMMMIGSSPAYAAVSDSEGPTGDVVLSDVGLSDVLAAGSLQVPMQADVQGYGLQNDRTNASADDGRIDVTFAGGALSDDDAVAQAQSQVQSQSGDGISDATQDSSDASDGQEQTTSNDNETSTTEDTTSAEDPADNNAQEGDATAGADATADNEQSASSAEDAASSDATSDQSADGTSGAGAASSDTTASNDVTPGEAVSAAVQYVAGGTVVRALVESASHMVMPLAQLLVPSTAQATSQGTFAPQLETTDNTTSDESAALAKAAADPSSYQGTYVYDTERGSILRDSWGNPYRVIAADKRDEDGTVRYAVAGSDDIMQLGSTHVLVPTWTLESEPASYTMAKEAKAQALSESKASDGTDSQASAPTAANTTAYIRLEGSTSDEEVTFKGGAIGNSISSSDFVNFPADLSLSAYNYDAAYVRIGTSDYKIDYLTTQNGKILYHLVDGQASVAAMGEPVQVADAVSNIDAYFQLDSSRGQIAYFNFTSKVSGADVYQITYKGFDNQQNVTLLNAPTALPKKGGEALLSVRVDTRGYWFDPVSGTSQAGLPSGVTLTRMTDTPEYTGSGYDVYQTYKISTAANATTSDGSITIDFSKCVGTNDKSKGGSGKVDVAVDAPMPIPSPVASTNFTEDGNAYLLRLRQNGSSSNIWKKSATVDTLSKHPGYTAATGFGGSFSGTVYSDLGLTDSSAQKVDYGATAVIQQQYSVWSTADKYASKPVAISVNGEVVTIPTAVGESAAKTTKLTQNYNSGMTVKITAWQIPSEKINDDTDASRSNFTIEISNVHSYIRVKILSSFTSQGSVALGTHSGATVQYWGGTDPGNNEQLCYADPTSDGSPNGNCQWRDFGEAVYSKFFVNKSKVYLRVKTDDYYALQGATLGSSSISFTYKDDGWWYNTSSATWGSGLTSFNLQTSRMTFTVKYAGGNAQGVGNVPSDNASYSVTEPILSVSSQKPTTSDSQKTFIGWQLETANGKTTTLYPGEQVNLFQEDSRLDMNYHDGQANHALTLTALWSNIPNEGALAQGYYAAYLQQSDGSYALSTELTKGTVVPVGASFASPEIPETLTDSNNVQWQKTKSNYTSPVSKTMNCQSGAVSSTCYELSWANYNRLSGITFNLNGGSGSNSIVSITGKQKGDSVQLPSATPTKTNYTFAGWMVTSLNGSSYDGASKGNGGDNTELGLGWTYRSGQQVKMPYGDVVLTAQWTADFTSVQFVWKTGADASTLTSDQPSESWWTYSITPGQSLTQAINGGGNLPVLSDNKAASNKSGTSPVMNVWSTASGSWTKNYLAGWYMSEDCAANPANSGCAQKRVDKSWKPASDGSWTIQNKVVKLYASWTERSFTTDVQPVNKISVNTGSDVAAAKTSVTVNITPKMVSTEGPNGGGSSGMLTPRLISTTWSNGSSSAFKTITSIGNGIASSDNVISFEIGLKSTDAPNNAIQDTLTLTFDAGSKQGGWNYTTTTSVTVTASVNRKTRNTPTMTTNYKNESVTFSGTADDDKNDWTLSQISGGQLDGMDGGAVQSVNADGTEYSVSSLLPGASPHTFTLSKEADGAYEQASRQYTVDDRPAAPTIGTGVGEVNVTNAKDGEKGKISVQQNNLNTTYEYKKKPDNGTGAGRPETWTKLGDSGHEASVEPGTYWVRQQATDSQFASSYATVTVKQEYTVKFKYQDDAKNDIKDKVKQGSTSAPESTVIEGNATSFQYSVPWDDLKAEGYSLTSATYQVGQGQTSAVPSGHAITLNGATTITYTFNRSTITVKFDYVTAADGSGNGVQFVGDLSQEKLETSYAWATTRKGSVSGTVGTLPKPGARNNLPDESSMVVPFYKTDSNGGYKFLGWQVKSDTAVGQETKDVADTTKIADIIGTGTSVTLVPKWESTATNYSSSWASAEQTLTYGEAAKNMTFKLKTGLDTGARIIKVSPTSQKFQAVGSDVANDLTWLDIPVQGAPAVSDLTGEPKSSGVTWNAGTYTAQFTVTYDGGTDAGLNIGGNIKSTTLTATLTIKKADWDLAFGDVNYANETVQVTGSSTVTEQSEVTLAGLPSDVQQSQVLKPAASAGQEMTLTLTKALDSTANSAEFKASKKARAATVNEWGTPDTKVTLTLTRAGDANHNATSIPLELTTRSAAPGVTATDAYGENGKGRLTATNVPDGRNVEHTHKGGEWVSNGQGVNYSDDYAGAHQVRLAADTSKQLFHGRASKSIVIQQYYKVTYKTELESGSVGSVDAGKDPGTGNDLNTVKIFRLGRLQKENGGITDETDKFSSIVNDYTQGGAHEAGQDATGVGSGWAKASYNDKSDTFGAATYTMPKFGSSQGDWETPGYDMVQIDNTKAASDTADKVAPLERPNRAATLVSTPVA